MKLRIAAEACLERSFEQGRGVAVFALRIILIEKTLHALSITEVDDGKPCLLFEESAETRRTKARTLSQVVEAVS